jgi:small subunit ribosomal protein S1
VSIPHEPVELPVWQQFLAGHADGGVLSGIVVDVLPFGAFVELADGSHGLLHMSEWSAAPEQGATVSVRILHVDLAGRRLSLKQV